MPILSQPYFRNEQAALTKLEALVWPHGPVCLHCGATTRIGNVIGKGARPGLKFCCRCRKQFRVTMGTPFEGSHVPIHKWLQACYLLTASDTGISAHQLHLRLDITNKTALAMVHRLAETTCRSGTETQSSAAAEARFPRVRWRRHGYRSAALDLGSEPDQGEGEEVPWAIPPAGATRQYQRFLETAQELRCRDDEPGFERVLTQILRHPAGVRQPRGATAGSVRETTDKQIRLQGIRRAR